MNPHAQPKLIHTDVSTPTVSFAECVPTSGGHILVKLGGAVCLLDETLDALAEGLEAMIHAGMRPVLVHGGGPQLDAALKGLGETVVKHKGLRYTSEAAAAVVQRELDRIGSEIATRLTARGLAATHVPTAAGVVAATPKVLDDGFELGRVGAVANVHAAAIQKSFQADDGGIAVPVVTPVGTDGFGPLNVNADEAAAAIAGALAATRLVLGTDVPYVLDGSGDAVRAVTIKDADKLIDDGAAKGGMIPKLRAATTALGLGVGDVVITRVDREVLLRLVHPIPDVGTLVSPNSQRVALAAGTLMPVEV